MCGQLFTRRGLSSQCNTAHGARNGARRFKAESGPVYDRFGPIRAVAVCIVIAKKDSKKKGKKR